MCSFILTAIDNYTAKVYTWRNRVPLIETGHKKGLSEHMGKLIRAVLRGRNGGNTILLPDKYEQEGVIKKLYGFSAILCYSRMRFATEVSRCDVPTLIRCLMEAFEYGWRDCPKRG